MTERDIYILVASCGLALTLILIYELQFEVNENEEEYLGDLTTWREPT